MLFFSFYDKGTFGASNRSKSGKTQGQSCGSGSGYFGFGSGFFLGSRFRLNTQIHFFLKDFNPDLNPDPLSLHRTFLHIFLYNVWNKVRIKKCWEGKKGWPHFHQVGTSFCLRIGFGSGQSQLGSAALQLCTLFPSRELTIFDRPRRNIIYPVQPGFCQNRPLSDIRST